MDACLEEVNKDSKVWQHGKMVALDWLRIFRNLGNLGKVCLPFLLACVYIYICQQAPDKKNAIYVIWQLLTGEVDMWTCVFMPDDNIILTLVGWDMTFIL